MKESFLVFFKQFGGLISNEFKFNICDFVDNFLETNPIDDSVIVEEIICIYQIVFVDLNEDFELSFSNVETVQSRQEVIANETADQ